MLPKILTPLKSSAQNIKKPNPQKQAFFSRTVEMKETIPSADRMVKAIEANTANQNDFQTEYLLYQYQRSPLYRALINHNV